MKQENFVTEKKIFILAAALLLSSCGAGLVVRRSSGWDRTDMYGKKIVVIPGLGAAGIRFSDPNPNRLLDKHLKKKLPAMPRFTVANAVYFGQSIKIFTRRNLWPVYNKLLKRFRNTGRLDTIILKKIGTEIKTRYLLVPLFLSTNYTSWEFTGIFSYYSAAVELLLFETENASIVFRVRARGYSLGGLEKAFASASEEICKTLR